MHGQSLHFREGAVLAACLMVFADTFSRQPEQTLYLPMPRDARLADGASVTTVALESGYASVSAFIAVFRRYLGASPRAYLAQADIEESTFASPTPGLNA